MPNVVAIISDDRVRKQIERFVSEMTTSDVRIATFSKLKEFEELYQKAKRAPAEPKLEALPPPPEGGAPPESPPETESEPVDLRLFSKVDALIINTDALVGERIPTWCSAMMRKTRELDLWPEGTRTRFILLKFEDDGMHKLDVLLPELDDLIYLPLDRLVFLQKLEIILGLPKKIKSSYLFNQPVKQEIEISKITKLERFNDVGLAVRNPVPLTPGMHAKFYVTLPGEKDNIRFFAKAIRSEPHPESPGQYLCYFTFFGLRKKETTRIRQWLTRGPKFKMFVSEDPSRFKLNPSDLEAVERAGAVRNVVVIDPDADQATFLASQIRKDMDNVQVLTESSYNFFVHKHIKGAKGGNEPPKPAKPDDLPNGMLKLEIKIDQKQLKKSSFQPADDELFFGHIAKDVFKIDGSDWWKPFSSVENDLVLDESINLLKERKSSSKVVVLSGATGERYAVRMKISPVFDPGSFDIEILPVPAEVMAEELGTAALSSLDALIIDAAFVPADFNAWIEFLKTSAKEKGLIKRIEDLKVLLISEREDRLDPAWLSSPHVIGLLLKPADTRQLMFLLAEAVRNIHTQYRFENVSFATTFVNAHLSRGMDIEWISEFGATLRSPTPFRPGTFFFLRKLIFDNAPNQCLAARVYFCEPHPEVKGQYQISVLYYGINDAFLRFARTWIRETYAQSKAQQA